jgi:DNA modification methylase
MIINDDCLEAMKKMEDNSISCIVTDCPYGIAFMGKEWDRGLPSKEYWQEMLRIVKPGGHLIAAGLPRMMHRLISVIEDAGWEVRDLLMHIFGSGFPKSHNHFGIEGYGIESL